MRIFLGLTIFLVFLGGCTSAPVKNTDTINTNSPDNSVAEKSNANNDSMTLEEFMNTNNASPAANSDGSELSGSPTGKNSRGKNTSSAPIDPHAATILTTAPDNSVISTSMNKQGAPIETRTFKDNPMLIKVERVYTDLKNPTVTVYLKNGKTYDLPKEKIDDIFNVSANDILNAVGVAPSK
ncbi:MAG: hypothetical protein ABI891_01265 [Acidobacteriota bacterium]